MSNSNATLLVAQAQAEKAGGKGPCATLSGLEVADLADLFAGNSITLTIDFGLARQGMGRVYGEALRGILTGGFPGTVKLNFIDSTLPEEGKPHAAACST